MITNMQREKVLYFLRQAITNISAAHNICKDAGDEQTWAESNTEVNCSEMLLILKARIDDLKTEHEEAQNNGQ